MGLPVTPGTVRCISSGRVVSRTRSLEGTFLEQLRTLLDRGVQVTVYAAPDCSDLVDAARELGAAADVDDTCPPGTAFIVEVEQT